MRTMARKAKVFPPAAEKARNHPNLHLLGFTASPKFPMKKEKKKQNLKEEGKS